MVRSSNLFLATINFVSFGLLFVFFNAVIRRKGTQWQLRDISDPAALPLVILIFAAFGILSIPISNSIVRMTEREADASGLNTSREPDGFAKVALKVGTIAN